MKIKLSRKVRHESKVADEVKTNEHEVEMNANGERRIESSIGAAAAVKRQSNDWRQ